MMIVTKKTLSLRLSCVLVFGLLLYQSVLAVRPSSPLKGFYLGLNAGYAAAMTQAHVSSPVESYYLDPTDVARLNALSSQRLYLQGFIVGGEAGYNWILGSYLLGIELGYDFSQLKNLNTLQTPSSGDPLHTTWTLTQEIQSDWLLMIRPRIGIISRDRFLLYLTGGPLLARLSSTNTYADDFVGPAHGPSNAHLSAQTSTIQGGWIVGLGEEIALSPHWSMKFEYDYACFPTLHSTAPLALAPNWPPLSQTLSYATEMQSQFIRLGVHYYF